MQTYKAANKQAFEAGIALLDKFQREENQQLPRWVSARTLEALGF